MNRAFVTAYAGMLLALTAASIDSILPILGMVAADLALSAADARLTMTALMASVGCGQIVFGPLADRFGRKPVLFAALGLYLIGSGLCASADAAGPLLAGRVLQGLGAAAGQIAARAILRDLYSGVQLAHVLSGATAVMAFAPMLSPLLGFVIASALSWRWVFASLFAFALVALIIAAASVRETLAKPNPDAIRPAVILRSCAQVLAHPQSLLFGAVLALCGVGLFSFIIGAQQIYSRSFGLSSAQIAVLHTCLGAAVIGGQVLNRRVIPQLGTVPTICAALTAALAGMLLGLGFDSLGMLGGYGFGACAALLAMCVMICVSNATALAVDPHGRIAGLAVSLIGVLSFGLSALAGGAVAGLVDGRATFSLIAISACLTMALALAALWLWRMRTVRLAAAAG